MPRAILLSKHNDRIGAVVRELSDADFPESEVRLRVAYSSLNYKDALAIARGEPVVRQWPMVPGIDASAWSNAARARWFAKATACC